MKTINHTFNLDLMAGHLNEENYPTLKLKKIWIQNKGKAPATAQNQARPKII